MDKPIVWLQCEIKTPPFSASARLEAGFLLRRVQRGDKLSMPNCRDMQQIESGVHELRIGDASGIAWRIIDFVDRDAILILEVFKKGTGETPDRIKATCRRRLTAYRNAARQGGGE